MSDIIQNIVFPSSGLNSDSAQKLMPLGDSSVRLHVSISDDGLEGELVNMMGTKLVSYQGGLALSRAYFAHGGYYNELQRTVYYFIFSQPYLDTSTPSPYEYVYDNRLLAYREDTGVIDTIFIDRKNYFGLDPEKPLIRPCMIKDWLFINPVTSQPKMIDVARAYNYTTYPTWDSKKVSYEYGDRVTFFGGLFVAVIDIAIAQSPSTHPAKWRRIGDSYQSESTLKTTEFDKAFYLIKSPPVDRIATAYGSDLAINFNNIEGQTFRFCHRYQYFDDSYSVCSAHSNITLPLDNELYNGTIVGSTTRNNYIKLFFSLYSPALVKNIEIFFQELEGDWKRLTVINRQDQTLLTTVSYTHNFYNNESYPIIDQAIPAKVQDAVPNRAQSQEIINENILCLGGVTEGFDNIDKDLIDVTLSSSIEQMSESISAGVVRRNNIGNDITYSSGFDTASGTYMYYADISVAGWRGASGIVNGDIYKAVVDGLVVFGTLAAGDIDTDLHFATRLVAILGTLNAASVISTPPVKVRLRAFAKSPEITYSSIYGLNATVTSFAKKTGFKTAAYHPFCLFYYDEALRRGSAQVTPDMSIYVPSVIDYVAPVSTTNYKWNINWAVSHEPPTWAKYWRWGYAGNKRCTYFVQYIVKSIVGITAPVEDYDVANSCKIDISPLQTIRTTTESGWNSLPNSIIPQYEFTEGDRIRFITESQVPGAATTLGAVKHTFYDFEIIKFEASANVVYTQGFDFTTPTLGQNTLVEIYTPKKNTEIDFYYEFGDIFPIKLDSDGNLVHGGKTTDQYLGVSPQAATGTFGNGDVYHISRTPSKPLATGAASTTGVFHESMWWSDFYKSDDWDKGKIGIENPIGEVTTNIIRYSNPYFQGTEINGLTTFEEKNRKEVNDVFGDIQAIVEVGDTLKVYQTKKASAILIGKTEYTDSLGQVTTPELTTRTLGSIRYPESNYGTIFPESIAKNNRYVYGFDVHNGIVWRDSPSGIFPISGRYAEAGGDIDYKMQTYFKNKSKALMESGVDHIKCIGAWDGENKMYVLSIKDTVNEVNNDTIMFHEPSNRWVTNADFTNTPEQGYNTMLELTWDVVRGFENGIGFDFDYDSRFAIFNVVMSPAVIATPLKSELNFSTNTPTVIILNTPVATAGTLTHISGFTANWNMAIGATGYYLDVATDSGFTSMVGGYNNLSIGNFLTKIVTGLDGRTNYYYRVRAVNTPYNMTTPDSNSITVPIVLPPPTTNGATNVTGTSFTANWNSVTGATGYFLDVSTVSDFSTLVAGWNNKDMGNNLTDSVTGLTTNTTYYFRVRAYNLFQTSISSDTRSQRLSTPPSDPVATGATNITTHGFMANWLASTGVLGYLLDVATDINFTSMVAGFSMRDVGNQLYFTVLGLNPETIYYYKVMAYNMHALASNYSNTATVKTLMTPPEAISATNIYSSGFTANWYAKAGASGYYLDVSITPLFTTFVTGFNNRDVLNVTAYNVTGLTQSVMYYYRLRVYSIDQTTGNSNTISQVTGQAPSVPAAQPANPILNDGFTANWYASTNNTGYKLDVATDSGFTSFVAGYNNKEVAGLADAVTGLNSNTPYYYRVRSHDDNGIYSAYSSTITVSTLGATVPDPPVATAATGILTDGFTANWNASAGATGYRIDISLSPTFSSAFIIGYTDLDVNNVTHLDVTGINPGYIYHYRVRAYSGGGTGSNSNSIMVATNSLPLPTISITPTTWNFGGTNTFKQVMVTITEATTWGVNFPSRNAYIHESTRDANSITLYYSGAFQTGDDVSFYATGAGGTTTTTFQGRWT